MRGEGRLVGRSTVGAAVGVAEEVGRNGEVLMDGELLPIHSGSI